MFSLFDRIQACDRWTDGRMDRHVNHTMMTNTANTRIAARGKNYTGLLTRGFVDDVMCSVVRTAASLHRLAILQQRYCTQVATSRAPNIWAPGSCTVWASQ